jgi:hypothetical protein
MRERGILERAVRTVAEKARNASTIVNEAHNAGLDGSHPVTLQLKMLRLELLNVKRISSVNSDGSCSIARSAAREAIGSRASECNRGIGRIGSPRHMVNQ